MVRNNNHYIPAFLLREWSRDGKRIHMYDTLVANEKMRTWTLSSINSTASISGLYVNPEDAENPDSLETAFDRTIESPAAPIVQRLNRRRRQLKTEEVQPLVDLLIAQRARTPQAMTRMFQAAEQYLEDDSARMVERTVANLRSADHIPAGQSETADTSWMHVSWMEEGIQIGIDLGLPLFHYGIRTALNGKGRRTLDEANWRLGFPPAAVPDLPIGDEPVIACLHQGEGGIIERGSMFALPLGPRTLLYTFIGLSKREMSRVPTPPEFYQSVRRCIVRQSRRRIYSSFEDPEIPRLRPRTVDAAAYQASRRLMV